jgi:signal transduction histidine kinase
MAYRAVAEANTALRGLNDLLEQQTRRISHELHDQAGQLLAAVYLQVDDLVRDLPGDASDRVKSIRDLLDSIEEHLRRISHELRPTILDDLGLVAALEFLAEGVSARAGLAVTVDGPRLTRFPETTELVLYRIVQEALTNVCKHAHAAAVRISVRQQDQEIQCCIADDGVGFDAHAALAGAGARGIGLMGIRERLMPLSGALRITSAPGRGTELLVTVPLGDMPGDSPVIPRPSFRPSPD